MAQPPPNRRRPAGFFWQGVLILLPVALLAAVGIWALRRDYVQTRAEARERAQALADAAANHLWTELNNGSRNENPIRPDLNRRWLRFTTDAQGELTAPVPELPLDPPPQPPHLASEDLRSAWAAAVQLSANSDTSDAIATWRSLISSNLPPQATARARFHLGQLLLAADQKHEAAVAFRFAAGNAEARLDSGLPLQMVAAWREFEAAPSDLSALEAACSNAVTRPNPVTTELLRRAAEIKSPGAAPIVERWRQRWLDDELSRALWRMTLPYRRWMDRAATNTTGAPRCPRALWAMDLDFLKPLRDIHEQAGRTGSFASLASPQARLLLWDVSPPEFGGVVANYVPYLVWPGSFPSTEKDLGYVRGTDFLGTGTLAIRPLPLFAMLKAANLLPPKEWSVIIAFAGDVEFSQGAWGGIISIPGAELLAIGTPTNCRDGSLRVKVLVPNPAAYFASQRQRLWGFTALLVAAAGASVVGFFSARRAFLRARQLSEMKSNFVSSVSHELRAPIASVRLMAENLERGKVADAGKQRDYFRFIVQECRRLSSLIENVLDFARIEQGRKQYDFEPTDIGALVAQTVELMQPAAAEKNVTLRIDAAPRSAELLLGEKKEGDGEQRAVQEHGAPLLDATAIQQALINLLDNAIKHSPAGATVVIGLTPPVPPVPPASSDASHASRFTLYVQDSGPGIPPEEHEKIFERFYRRGSELRRETPGVGIGLSIVKHIAEAHGGRVVVESEVGKGSRFAIELPVNQQEKKR